jgi:5-methylcytosine-specific restriction endonuclease McrA
LLQLGKARVQCRTCGVTFVRESRNRRYCSPECSYQTHIDRIMGLYRTAAQTGRVKEAMHWRYALIGYLRDRDGSRCALCGSVMNFKDSTGARGDNDDGASVDHVVPWSLTRDDSLSNLQLAHWSCNRSKGARVPGCGEQLRLVG